MTLQGPALNLPEHSHKTLLELFSYSFTHYSDMPAFSDAGKVYTYRDINRLSRKFAAYLQNQTELQPGDRIIVQLPNMLQYPVAAIGAIRAGLVLVNSNPLYTSAEIQYQLQDSAASALVVLAERAPAIAAIIPGSQIKYCFLVQEGDLLGFPHNVLNNLKRMWQQHLHRHVDGMSTFKAFSAVLTKGDRLKYKFPDVLPDQLALLQYTAGTSGDPRGVMLSHTNLLANLQQIKQVFGDLIVPGKEVAIVPLPLYHIYSFTLNMLVLQEAGAHRVLIRDAQDVDALLNEMLRWPFTLFSGLNSLFMALCRTPELQRVDFTALKLTISGGMALSDSVMNCWKLITGCGIIDGYGLTETSPVVAVNSPKATKSATVGTPLPGTAVKVVGEQGEILPEGEAGELFVQGPQVMQGYWRDPVATHAVLNNSGWLATGDIARLSSDGSMTLIDRKSDLIHVANFTIYPNELENVITSHPDVLECAVIGVPNGVTGEQIKAYIVSVSSRLSVKAIRDYCRERLTTYKVPHQVEFCQSIPRSSIGKIKRRSLREEPVKSTRRAHE
ncbi:MAG: AMP-binding protein [Amphritea sp.]